jgi:hypothetical protein
MATVLPHTTDRAGSDRRVRHPLQSLRGYIRTYVTLEGTFVALIYLALWFWIGLALDWGPFRLFAFDWVQELNGAMDPSTAFVVRACLLALLTAGLLGVVAFKIVRRLLTEFSDAALALVLERRFPRQLGDRLITAVELADHGVGEKYGFSQALIDHTIRDAAERVEQVPVTQVFNWGRLWRQGFLAGLCTLGMYLLVFLGYAGYAVATDNSAGDYMGRFNTVAAIWTERNILLMDSYWPRRAYLEVLHFQDAQAHPGEMRIARDEQRPDLLVRAFQWVVADGKVEGGWRPLRWHDLPKLVDADLANVALVADYTGWAIDFDDLDPSVPAGAIPAEWNGQKSGIFWKLLKRNDPHDRLMGIVPSSPFYLEDIYRNKVFEVGGKKLPPMRLSALAAIQPLLDWHDWTLDKIAQQLEQADVRQRMRRFEPKAYAQFEKLFGRLEELADDPGMARRLRKLEIPDQVYFCYRGATSKGEIPEKKQERNQYTIGLGDLKESARFTVQGEDFYTPSRTITLVPPPSLVTLTLTKDEPAYIYWRLQGDQKYLKGQRQHFEDVSVSITGEISHIPLPLGSSLELHARADRPIKDGVRLAPPANPKMGGAHSPTAAVTMDADNRGFRTGFQNVTRPIEFEMQFYDLDGVKGRRHVVIEPVDDRGPQEVVPVELTVDLPKPRAPGKGGQANLADGFLITPDALLPFRGTFQDDYGLTDLSWSWRVEEVDFELSGASRTGKGMEGALIPGGRKIDRPSLVVSGLQAMPVGNGEGLLGPPYWAWTERVLAYDLARAAKGPSVKEGSATLEFFKVRLDERAGEAIPRDALKEKLQGPAPKLGSQLRLHDIKNEEGFDLRKYLASLKVSDPTREAQLHYRVQLFVAATDNNVETGSGPEGTRVLSKIPVTLLVVSENELLARLFLDEEQLRQRLEKAVERLETSRSILDDQITKLQSPQPRLGLVSIRTDEVRKNVQDATSTTREVSGDYNRILKVMRVNRVTPSRVDKVDNDICRPLEDVLDPRTGNFTLTESAVSKLIDGIEEDMARLKKAQDAKQANDTKLLADLEARRAGHLQVAGEAREHLARLIERMKGVLNAIGGELVERELIALLLQIERDQRDTARRLLQMRNDLEDVLLGGGGRPQ